MPIYAYRCRDCSAMYEERKSFTQVDEPSICPVCEGRRVQKLITAPIFLRGDARPAASAGGCACSSGGSCACQSVSSHAGVLQKGPAGVRV